jgi:nucleoside-diphosphate-sugar epimerase
MTILVTGASGFLGRHLVDRLLLREYAVRTLSRSHGGGLPAHVEHIQGDIRDVTLLEAAMAGVERVYHAAAMVPGSGSDTRMWDINVIGTRSVAQACLRAGVRRLVLVSSVAVYKAPLPDLVSESASAGGGLIYGRSKAMAEIVATDICRGRLELVIARPCQIFGTMDRTGFTKKLLRLVKSPLLPVAGPRGRSFSLIHVSDVADGLCAAGERKDIDGAIINLACKKRTSLIELASIYSKLVGKKARGTKVPIPESILRAAMSLQSAARNLAQARRDSLFGAYGARSTHGSILLGGPVYDIQKAITLLDFSPKITFEQGLLQLIGEEAVKRGRMSRGAPDSVAMTRP